MAFKLALIRVGRPSQLDMRDLLSRIPRSFLTIDASGFGADANCRW